MVNKGAAQICSSALMPQQHARLLQAALSQIYSRSALRSQHVSACAKTPRQVTKLYEYHRSVLVQHHHRMRRPVAEALTAPGAC